MTGEEFSTSTNGKKSRDTTFIQCDGYTFEFKQHDIHLRQRKFYNQTIITTTITVKNLVNEKVQTVLNIIDDICWLLSFAQQSYVYRYGYEIDNKKHYTDSSAFLFGSKSNIIEARGNSIRNFIENTYPTFKKIKNSRQLPVVISYLCEANRVSLAHEIALISHYVAIENLKHSFAISNGFIQKKGILNIPILIILTSTHNHLIIKTTIKLFKKIKSQSTAIKNSGHLDLQR